MSRSLSVDTSFLILALKQLNFEQLSLPSQRAVASKALFEFIDQLPQASFALPKLLEALNLINHSFSLEKPLSITHFETWLNLQSDSNLGLLDRTKNLEIRAKIAGRSLPRDEYQRFFPISMGKHYSGNHIVTAHSSPDLDTAVASFWSWLDAFAIRLSEKCHIWNLPGSCLSDQDARVFEEYLGPGVFDYLCQGNGILTQQAADLLNETPFYKLDADSPLHAIDAAMLEKGVLLVDKEGYYLGEYRSEEAATVSELLTLLDLAFGLFKQTITTTLNGFFSDERATAQELTALITKLENLSFADLEPVKNSPERLLQQLNLCLEKLFSSDKGLDTRLANLFEKAFKNLHQATFFDSKGSFVADRAGLLQKVLELFENEEMTLKQSYQTLGVAFTIKELILKAKSEPVEADTELEALREKLGEKSYLSVIYTDRMGRKSPLGIVTRQTLKRRYVATVSLRDFSNREEVEINDSFDIISIVDHHKSDIHSANACVAIISDTQSCNTLIAEQQLALNDLYSSAGQTLSSIRLQKKALQTKERLSASEQRLLFRLMQRERVLSESKESTINYFVCPERERAEYLFYLYAILDDTDLLAKVSHRDLFCVVTLINRIDSLEKQEEVERLSLNNLTRDETFLKKAKERILQDPGMYQLYSKVYSFKETSITHQIDLCLQALPNTLFSDTKVQNSSSRIGQIKLMPSLILPFQKAHQAILKTWLKDCAKLYESSEQRVNLFLQMVSTVAGAKEVYEKSPNSYNHRDELWFWVPSQEAFKPLIYFLKGFCTAREIEKGAFEIELLGSDTDSLKTLFEQHFIKSTFKQDLVSNPKSDLGDNINGSLAILRFEAGKLNSRKAVISPYLPKVL